MHWTHGARAPYKLDRKRDAVMVDQEEIARRKLMTFAQAEGVDPLPRQLAIGEISDQLRALLGP